MLQKLQQDLIAAMKAGDKARVDTLRFLIAAIKRFEIDAYPPASDKSLTDDDVIKIIQKQVKTHRESVEAFQKAGRVELVDKENKELEILRSYVPKEMNDEEIKAIVERVKTQGISNFGQAMGMVMKEVAGKADGNRVAKFVKEIFGSS